MKKVKDYDKYKGEYEVNNNTEKYKRITLNYNKMLRKKDLYTIEVLNKTFNKNDMRIEHNGKNITILLKTIDITKLKNQSTSPNGTVNQSIINDIIDSIEQIKSYSINGNKRNYVDYNKERKVKDRKNKEIARTQYYYAQDNTFSKTNNELPNKYQDRIIKGDSETVLKNVPDNSIDLVFTSPPYNFGLNYAHNRDAHYWEDYFEKLFKIFKECIRVVKYGGRIIVNVQPLFSDYIPSHHIISNFFMREKLIWKGEILWEKNNYNCKYTAWGSWKSPSNPYLKYTWEFLEVFCKGDLKKTGLRNNIDISADEFKKWVTGRWSIAPERKMKEYGHPAMFPEKLVERVLKLFSYKRDVVLDPFNGVGTTSVVAHKLGRRYLGIDISEDYCKTARQRLNGIQCSLI